MLRSTSAQTSETLDLIAVARNLVFVHRRLWTAYESRYERHRRQTGGWEVIDGEESDRTDRKPA